MDARSLRTRPNPGQTPAPWQLSHTEWLASLGVFWAEPDPEAAEAGLRRWGGRPAPADWEARDHDDSTERPDADSIARDHHRPWGQQTARERAGWRPEAYRAYVALDRLEPSIENDDDLEEPYDWEELADGIEQGAVPPPKLRLDEDGWLFIADGNHRTLFWEREGFTHAPAWVIDYGAHRAAVEAALGRGEAVPPEVLADYPELSLARRDNPARFRLFDNGGTSRDRYALIDARPRRDEGGGWRTLHTFSADPTSAFGIGITSEISPAEWYGLSDGRRFGTRIGLEDLPTSLQNYVSALIRSWGGDPESAVRGRNAVGARAQRRAGGELAPARRRIDPEIPFNTVAEWASWLSLRPDKELFQALGATASLLPWLGARARAAGFGDTDAFELNDRILQERMAEGREGYDGEGVDPILAQLEGSGEASGPLADLDGATEQAARVYVTAACRRPPRPRSTSEPYGVVLLRQGVTLLGWELVEILKTIDRCAEEEAEQQLLVAFWARHQAAAPPTPKAPSRRRKNPPGARRQGPRRGR